MRLCSPEYIVPRLWWCFCDSPTVVKNSESRKKELHHMRAHQDTYSIPLPSVIEIQKVNTRNRHQRRHMARKVRNREAKPEFKIGMRRKVTRGKLLRRTKHTHPALLMASLCGRPRWPCGCRHISFSNLFPSEQTTIFPLLFTPRSPCPANSEQHYKNLPTEKLWKKKPPFFLPLTTTKSSCSSYSRPVTTKTKTRTQDHSQTDPLKIVKDKSCALARGGVVGGSALSWSENLKKGQSKLVLRPLLDDIHQFSN